MGIIRIEKNKNYFVASNIPFNDKNLSWEARGMMGYLLSKPDDWKISFTDLVRQSKAGGHVVRRILKELEENAYLYRERLKNPETGQFEWVSTIYESPSIYQSSIYGEPTRGKPRDIINTDKPNTKNHDDDKKFSKIIRAYENQSGTINGNIAESLNGLVFDWNDYAINLVDEHPNKKHDGHDVVLQAIGVMGQHINRPNLKYLQKIIDNWMENGYMAKKPGRSPKAAPELPPSPDNRSEPEFTVPPINIDAFFTGEADD